jgi:hypothetical protein
MNGQKERRTDTASSLRAVSACRIYSYKKVRGSFTHRIVQSLHLNMTMYCLVIFKLSTGFQWATMKECPHGPFGEYYEKRANKETKSNFIIKRLPVRTVYDWIPIHYLHK